MLGVSLMPSSLCVALSLSARNRCAPPSSKDLVPTFTERAGLGLGSEYAAVRRSIIFGPFPVTSQAQIFQTEEYHCKSTSVPTITIYCLFCQENKYSSQNGREIERLRELVDLSTHRPHKTSRITDSSSWHLQISTLQIPNVRPHILEY